MAEEGRRYPSRAALAVPNRMAASKDEGKMPAEVDTMEVEDSAESAASSQHDLSAIDLNGVSLIPTDIGGHNPHRASLPAIEESSMSRDTSLVRDDSMPQRRWSSAAHDPPKPDEVQAPATPSPVSGVKFCEDLPTRKAGSEHGADTPLGNFRRTRSGQSELSNRSHTEYSRSHKGESSSLAKKFTLNPKAWRQKGLAQGTFKGMFTFKNKMQNNYGFGHQTMQRITHFHLKADDVTVGEKIGEGCIGEVFLGDVASMPDRAVAIKKLREGLDSGAEEVEGLTAELRVLSKSLKHPNVVEFVGLCIKNNALLIVMELMEGGSLEDHFSQLQESGGSVYEPLSLVLAWSTDLMRGLAYLHEKNPPLIHRDLKPGNLMLSGDRKSVKIADFGLAKSVEALAKQKQRQEGDAASEADTEEHPSPLVENNAAKKSPIVGTPRYIPPEVWGRTGVATDKVDIYAAALVIWAMVEGKRPWDTLAGDVAATMAKTCDRPPMNPRRFPARLSQVLTEGWAMEPESRPSARALLQDLQPLQEEERAKEGKRRWFETSGSGGSFRSGCIPFAACCSPSLKAE